MLIDDAVWPAHGRLWGHLVSDTSLDELHDFARRAGMPERGFDHDHYDYPEERREQLIALGAVPVSGRELVKRLTSSGLRVSQRQKRAVQNGASPDGAETLERTHDRSGFDVDDDRRD